MAQDRETILHDLDTSFKSILGLVNQALGTALTTKDPMGSENSRNGASKPSVCNKILANIKSFTDIIKDPKASSSSPPPNIPSRNPLETNPKSNPNRQNARRKLRRIRENRQKGILTCYRCGERNHISSQCRNAVIYFNCGRLGHRSTNCRVATLRTSSMPLISLIYILYSIRVLSQKLCILC
jgi:Zinc knuckle